MCATRASGVGFRVYGVGFCFECVTGSQNLEGGPYNPLVCGAGEFSWSAARAFNTCEKVQMYTYDITLQEYQNDKK